MTKIKIQINGTGKTHKEICDALCEIAKQTNCSFCFEGLHPKNESNPFIWVDYSGGNIFEFGAKLDKNGLVQRICSLTAGIPDIDSLPT